ncbi:hypothetical protein KIW84_045598 [Lathyrus oleraceus]|uniref:Uncharacterized protein n=1 Tax=Pisum sativum TaxID=3888 RepID=A0A9D5AXF4_PEA|nr:hypothetical protein KIW84_045598 [Pisum sativum]
MRTRTQHREEIERTFQNPHGLEEAMTELYELRFTAQCLRKSREDVKKCWEAKVVEKEKEIKKKKQALFRLEDAMTCVGCSTPQTIYVDPHNGLISKMDPIKYIFDKLTLTSRTKAIKDSVLADHLAQYHVEDYQPLKFDFPDEDIMAIKDYEIPDPDEQPEKRNDGLLCSMVLQM